MSYYEHLDGTWKLEGCPSDWKYWGLLVNRTFAKMICGDALTVPNLPERGTERFVGNGGLSLVHDDYGRFVLRGNRGMFETIESRLDWLRRTYNIIIAFPEVTK